MLSHIKPFLAGCSVAGLILASAGAAANTEYEETTATDEYQSATVDRTDTEYRVEKHDKELSDASEDFKEAAEVVKRLKADDPELAQRLNDAHGVFVIPDYATASLLVGGSGGEGILFDRRDGQWGNPVFYNVGSIDIGAQAGAAAGSLVMLLMSDDAFQNFHSETEFSLTAEAGLTIVNWSATAPATTEEGDIIVWSDMSGLLAEASVGVGGISFDEEENREYYGQEVTAEQVLAGQVENPHQDVLESEFAEFTTDDEMPREETPRDWSTEETESPSEYEGFDEQ